MAIAIYIYALYWYDWKTIFRFLVLKPPKRHFFRVFRDFEKALKGLFFRVFLYSEIFSKLPKRRFFRIFRYFEKLNKVRKLLFFCVFRYFHIFSKPPKLRFFRVFRDFKNFRNDCFFLRFQRFWKTLKSSKTTVFSCFQIF